MKFIPVRDMKNEEVCLAVSAIVYLKPDSAGGTEVRTLTGWRFHSSETKDILLQELEDYPRSMEGVPL